MVTREEAAQVAKLARLELTDDELSRLAEELSAILDHVEELQRAEVDGAENIGHLDWFAPMRPDTLGPDALTFPPAALSPHTQAGFFTVPRLAALDQDTPSA